MMLRTSLGKGRGWQASLLIRIDKWPTFGQWGLSECSSGPETIDLLLHVRYAVKLGEGIVPSRLVFMNQFHLKAPLKQLTYFRFRHTKGWPVHFLCWVLHGDQQHRGSEREQFSQALSVGPSLLFGQRDQSGAIIG